MGWRESLSDEYVETLALRAAITVSSETIVRGAVAQMRFNELGCAVVVDSRQRPMGIFTERSVIDVLVEDVSLDDQLVGRFLDSKGLQVRRSDPMLAVWDTIQQRGFRFVCVTDDEGRLVGVTGQRGLAEYVAEAQQTGKLQGSGLEQSLADECVTAIPSRPYAEVAPGTSIRRAVRVLQGLKVASLLVVDEGQLVGIFTERDVLERVAERYERMADLPVSEAMTTEPLVVRESDPVSAALATIAEAGYRHVPVLSDQDELRGIVSPRRLFGFLEERFAEAEVV